MLCVAGVQNNRLIWKSFCIGILFSILRSNKVMCSRVVVATVRTTRWSRTAAATRWDRGNAFGSFFFTRLKNVLAQSLTCDTSSPRSLIEGVASVTVSALITTENLTGLQCNSLPAVRCGCRGLPHWWFQADWSFVDLTGMQTEASEPVRMSPFWINAAPKMLDVT